MAIIEIAKIQVRRGQENQTGVPILDGGEFAWAADTENLYIGLRREDGGSRDANIRVLTENDLRNFFDADPVNSSTYIYKVETLITAEDGSNEFARTVQAGLDDGPVSLKAFGDVGVGGYFNDDTAILQLAIDNLFLNALELNQDPHATLYLPSGVYNITSTIYIPANTTIIGDGKEKTIINLKGVNEHAFQTVDGSSIGSALGGGSGYVTFENTGTNGFAFEPNNIRIENLTIQYDSSSTTVTNGLSLVEIAASSNSIIRNVKFKGHHLPGDDGMVSTYSGIDIRGWSQITTNNLLIENCEFDGLYHGVISNYDIVNPIIKDSVFTNLKRGISFNDPKDSGATFGPRYGKIENNKFDNIEYQGIYAGANSVSTGTRHVSMNNTFLNVGNYGYNEGYTSGTAVISYNSKENTSVNDTFRRYEIQNQNPGSSNKFYPLLEGSGTIDSFAGSVATSYGGLSTTILRLPVTSYNQYVTVKYNAYNATIPIRRKGELMINISEGSIPTVSITDNYSYTNTSDGGITWSSTSSGALTWLEIKANNSSGYDVTIEYQYNIMV